MLPYRTIVINKLLMQLSLNWLLITRRVVLITIVSISIGLLLSTCSSFAPQEEQRRIKSVPRCNLPCQCKALYAVGKSREWFQCMGVDYK